MLHESERRHSPLYAVVCSTSASSQASTDAAPVAGKSLMPLTLFAASPGTITGVITLSAAHTRFGFPITALAAVVVASAVTWSPCCSSGASPTKRPEVDLRESRLRALWG